MWSWCKGNREYGCVLVSLCDAKNILVVILKHKMNYFCIIFPCIFLRVSTISCDVCMKCVSHVAFQRDDLVQNVSFFDK